MKVLGILLKWGYGSLGFSSAVNLRFNLRLTLTQPVMNVLAHPLLLCQSEIESEIDR